MQRQRFIMPFLTAMLAIAAVAPLASADSCDRDRGRHSSRYDGYSSSWRDDRSGQGNRNGQGYRNWQGDRSWQGNRSWQNDRSWQRDRHESSRRRYGNDRDYFYVNVSNGQQSQYISDFKGCHDRYGRSPLIQKVDIASGQCLASYRFDDRSQRWRSCDNESYGWNR